MGLKQPLWNMEAGEKKTPEIKLRQGDFKKNVLILFLNVVVFL